MNWIPAIVERNRKQRAVWNTIPNSSVGLVMAVAFCLFASVGVLSQLDARTPPHWHLWLVPLVSGGFAAAIVWSAVRGKMWGVFVIIAAFMAALFCIRFLLPSGPSMPAEIQRRLTATAALAVAFIASGWTLALLFINREGERLFRVQAEMGLAGEIHKALVPTIERQIGDYEFYGISLPSGTVGGDLVDVLTRDGRWLAYVADVSGHGVNSGVLMAMIKSSIHTTLRFQPQVDGLLEEVNWVLCSLKATNMFATCGLIGFAPDLGMRYALAGHLPILRLRDQQIAMLSESNLPLGILPDTRFQATACEMSKGDVLIIMTDGLTEVTGKDGKDLGVRGISQALRDCGGRPVKEIAAQILRAVNGHGAQVDDQSLLIVRRLA